jgi:hypothetical protein
MSEKMNLKKEEKIWLDILFACIESDRNFTFGINSAIEWADNSLEAFRKRFPETKVENKQKNV